MTYGLHSRSLHPQYRGHPQPLRCDQTSAVHQFMYVMPAHPFHQLDIINNGHIFYHMLPMHHPPILPLRCAH